MSINKLTLVVLIVSGVALVTHIIGVAVPYWFSSEADGGSVTVTVTTTTYSGLWQYCTKTEYSRQNTGSCDGIGDYDTAGLRAVQAMEMIGLALLGGVVVCLVVKLACIKDNKKFSIAIAIVAIAAGVFIILGPIIYATDVKNDLNFSGSDLHAGFALVIIASVMCFVIGGLAFFIP